MSGELVLPGALTETALVLPAKLTLEEWSSVGKTLSRIERSCMWWIGDWWRYGEHAYGERAAQVLDQDTFSYQTFRDAGWVAARFEPSRRRDVLSWSHHKEVAALDPEEQDRLLDLAEQDGLSRNELRAAVRQRRAINPPSPPEGTYRTIVIDPPWPVEKIVREVRPKQGPALEYPTMGLDEIRQLPVARLADPAGCHIYLWVTHAFLPAGLDLLVAWGARYQCQLTWVKNVGVTPFSWMYDTEHVLFARIGSLDLMRKGLRLSMQARATGHSVKPEVFYERVCEASPEPRLEMFARRARPGFVAWGNEVAGAA